MQSMVENMDDRAMSSTSVLMRGMAKCCWMISALRRRRSKHTRGALRSPLSTSSKGKLAALLVGCTRPSASIALT